jgi:hypothetical protein
MLLEASCHCGAVTFKVRSRHPHPFSRCYCTICRKTMGGGGYSINLRADSDTLEVVGEEHITVYQAQIQRAGDSAPSQSSLERKFCSKCGSGLWCYDKRWPEMIHPFASAVDTPLPVPPESNHIWLSSKATWVEPRLGGMDRQFSEYPTETLAGWHERLGLIDEE